MSGYGGDLSSVDEKTEELAADSGRGRDAQRGGRERHAPLVAGVAIALPTLLAHYPPMSDLPLHEGIVGLLRHWGDAAYLPPDLYTLNLGHANQLFHLVAWALSFLVGTVWAVKLVVAAAQLLIFVLGARFADHLGRSRWGVLLLAPLALGFTYYWGLVANLVGFAALLGVLPTIDRAAVDPTWRKAAAVCGLLVLVFFAHEAVFVAAVGVVVILAVAHPFERRKTFLRILPVLAAVAFMVAQWIYQARLFTRGQVTPPAVFDATTEKLSALPSFLFGSHEPPVLAVLFGSALAAVLLLVVARVREQRSEPRAGAAGLRGWLLRYRFELTAAGFLFFYLVMPLNWRGATLVYQRFLGPAWALLAIGAAPRVAPRAAKLLASVLPVAVLLLAWPSFVESDEAARDLDAIMDAIPLKSSVALVAIDKKRDRPRMFSTSVGPARTVARRGGRVSLGLAISPISPVQIRAQYRWDEMDARTLMYGSRALKPANDLDRFGWVIAESHDPHLRTVLTRVLQPEAELVMERGEWLLFRSTKPQAPLTSPDVPAREDESTVVDRVIQYEQRPRSSPPP